MSESKDAPPTMVEVARLRERLQNKSGLELLAVSHIGRLEDKQAEIETHVAEHDEQIARLVNQAQEVCSLNEMLVAENRALRARLESAEAAMRAIRATAREYDGVASTAARYNRCLRIVDAALGAADAES